MADWKELAGNRLIKDMGEYSLIIPNMKTNRVPLDCPVCTQLMSSHEDVISFRNFSCCSQCELEWAYPNKEKWSNGWRPPQETIQAELDKRNKLPSFMYHVK